MQNIIIILFFLWVIDVCASFYQSGSIFPVYRHWKGTELQKIVDLNVGQKSYGLSLFPLVDGKLVKPLLDRKSGPLVCAFGVEKLKDLHSLYEAGCRVIGTTVNCREIIREAKLNDMIVICSGAVPFDYNEALMQNVDGFQIVLEKTIKMSEARNFLDKVKLDHGHLDIPVFVTPSATGDDIERMAALDDMVEIMMGFNLVYDDTTTVATMISQYNERLRKAYLERRIKSDLHNSCL